MSEPKLLQILNFVVPEQEATIEKLIRGLHRVLTKLRDVGITLTIEMSLPERELAHENELFELVLIYEVKKGDDIYCLWVARIDIIDNRPYPVYIYVTDETKEVASKLVNILREELKIRELLTV